jgi:methyl-accepting chemotaxis protein
MGSLWSQLSLRVQAAVAVAFPCVAVALFASIFFPWRMNNQARQAIVNQTRTITAMAARNATPAARMVNDGIANMADLIGIFEGVRNSGEMTQVGLLVIDAAAPLNAAGHRVVRVRPAGPGKDSDASTQMKGDLPDGEYEVPAAGECLVIEGIELDVRCSARANETEATFVTRQSLKKLAAQQRENQVIGIWVLLAALATGLALALLFSGAIAGPLGVISRVAREVAGGDVTVPQVVVGGSHEIRSMASSVNDMLTSLRGIVTQMRSLTGRLSDAAAGLTNAAADQTHVTSQQSAYAQQIAATFEELSRTAEMITRSTEVVEHAASRTANAVDDARSVVDEMVDGMTFIRRDAKEVADAITRLNGDLQQVSRIAQVIKQVADRSDLLALNAALEGTKAGDVGRGFSVVAAEMRKLAESVAQSAKDIGRIVENVQRSSDAAVVRANQGVDSSDKGVAVAQKAVGSFAQILELSKGTREAAQQIAIATRQQRESSSQAVEGARSVADLVKQGVDATSRTTQIATDLQASVAALTAVTNRFSVETKAPSGEKPS